MDVTESANLEEGIIQTHIKSMRQSGGTEEKVMGTLLAGGEKGVSPSNNPSGGERKRRLGGGISGRLGRSSSALGKRRKGENVAAKETVQKL